LINRAPSLSLTLLTPTVRSGEQIIVEIEAFDAPQVTVSIHPPDTVVISQPHCSAFGPGSFLEQVNWTVEHAQTTTTVEITTDPIPQTALCRVLARRARGNKPNR